ncbi:MAG: PAS domain S-box protein [Kouleothrix sp.]|nr:PAS domain S-box protein [Kouleothrix sp.]
MSTRSSPAGQPQGERRRPIDHAQPLSDEPDDSITPPSDPAEAQLWLASLVASSDDAIISKTLDGSITSWNAAAQRIYGYTAKEALGASILLIIPPRQTDEFVEIMQLLREGHRIDHFETTRVHKSGRHINVSVTISPIKDATGRIIGASTIARDITERKQAEEERAQLLEREQAARLEAQQAVRLRDQFLSIASHELKTPLTSLLGNAQLLERRAQRASGFAERDLRSIRVIADQSGRLNRMINTMLDISRIQLGRLSIDRAPLDLSALARRVVADSQPLLVLHTVELQAPEGAMPIIGDELRLEQALQNLVQNALKYSPSGGAVRVAALRRGQHACVSVSDQGIGIPPDSLPHLFQRFYRASNVDEQHISGMGIGLYLVKEIVALHGGSIEVESVEGQGSTFTLSLPLDPPEAAEATPYEPA